MINTVIRGRLGGDQSPVELETNLRENESFTTTVDTIKTLGTISVIVKH